MHILVVWFFHSGTPHLLIPKLKGKGLPGKATMGEVYAALVPINVLWLIII